MIISVASGKGGTGKTTVATNLAYSMGIPVQIIDCDVEEPNAHLFLKPDIYEDKKAYAMIPEIDENACNQCKKCAEICRFRAITVIGETVLTFPELCHGCGGCIEVCPEKAIREAGRELGIIEKGGKDGLSFVHGRLRIGEAMSPPLIKKVREQQELSKDIIIDAPPGTSCPVVASIKHTDFVLMVTEPTPFGLHDLKLAVEAVQLLGIPKGLVINRSDLGNDRVKEYAEQEALPVLMEIPFDRKIAEIYSNGRLLAEELPEWKTGFRDLFTRIKDIVNG
jgi:MinD superfamily P-loop ATPase